MAASAAIAAATTIASAVMGNQASQEAKSYRPQAAPTPVPTIRADYAADAARMAALQQRKAGATGFSSTVLSKPKANGPATPSPLTAPAALAAARMVSGGTTTQPALAAPSPAAFKTRLGA